MSEAKSYKKQEASEDYVAEPMAMKYSTVAEDAGYLWTPYNIRKRPVKRGR